MVIEFRVTSTETAPNEYGAPWPRRTLFETSQWLQAPWFAREYRYAITHRDGLAHGATVFKIVDDPAEYDAHNLRDLFSLVPPVFPEQSRLSGSRTAVASLSSECWFPNIVALFPGYVSTVLTPVANGAGHATELISAFVDWSVGKQMRAISFPYVREDDETFAQAALQCGFRSIPMTNRSVLTVPAGGFSSYLASLPSKRARECRRELKQMQERGVSIHAESLDGETFDHVLRLRLSLIAKYGHKIDEEKERTRLSWLRTLSSTRLFCARTQNNEVIGFTLFLENEKNWVAYMTGSQSGELGRFLYFCTAFYAPLQWLGDQNSAIASIDYGIGHNYAKEMRGCQNSPMNGWFLPLHPDLKSWANAVLE